ncbi:MAG: class II aldolase/adducin family protein [Ketobacteraceae bacterium]|nr:class II aldolase/adducin family protein [Ketobacteraceae bacterium]
MPHEEEGVIKYHLNFEAGEPPSPLLIEDINNWRTLLHQMQLMGQDPQRYGGLGFGNISCRLPDREGKGFVVSGTQTGHLHQLEPEHYCTVTDWDIAANQLWARGAMQPSSEAITHGAIYDLSDEICVVIHVHSPEIWQCAGSLRLSQTGTETGYGTPQLAREIRELYESGALEKSRLVVIPGHLDGVISFGATAEHAGHEIVKTLASAIQNFK